ncbi:hypothetical protein GOP47_0005986 [Adiantum capillus-veneris]|uniref:F-box/LRR-repeat protein 15/At3g58940/PEG3-like LRR domain-containing protein n=1 Tax=Adiantum capillus-veneris TaxID=13818 RepID=A0A9D4V202_ADICA|nr:hypothetical protein GOP47_0005986 [Adiantum capillus-veneris]
MLEELCLDFHEGLDTAAMAAIVQELPRLRVLHVTYCSFIEAASWQAPAAASPQLEELDICHCIHFRGDSLLAVQEGCPRLRLLTIPSSNNRAQTWCWTSTSTQFLVRLHLHSFIHEKNMPLRMWRKRSEKGSP